MALVEDNVVLASRQFEMGNPGYKRGEFAHRGRDPDAGGVRAGGLDGWRYDSLERVRL